MLYQNYVCRGSRTSSCTCSPVRVVPRLAGGLLTVASLSVFLTMALALAYGYSAFPATGVLITIGEMINWHGTLDAFGFAFRGCWPSVSPDNQV